MEIPEKPQTDDFPEVAELSTSAGPRRLDGWEDLLIRENEEPLDEIPVPSEGQPSGVTGLVMGNAETRRREQAAFWSED